MLSYYLYDQSNWFVIFLENQVQTFVNPIYLGFFCSYVSNYHSLIGASIVNALCLLMKVNNQFSASKLANSKHFG